MYYFPGRGCGKVWECVNSPMRGLVNLGDSSPGRGCGSGQDHWERVMEGVSSQREGISYPLV